MLKWEDARCFLTLNQWMEDAPANSGQLFELLRLRLCLFTPSMHFSVACVARGWTPTEPTTPVSFLRVVVARVCDATSVALRVRSYSCPRHIDCKPFLSNLWEGETETKYSLSCS